MGQLENLFFEASSDALVAINMNSFSVVHVNNAFLYLTGFAREEIVGEDLNSIASLHRTEELRARSLNRELITHPGLYTEVNLGTKFHELRVVTVKVAHVEQDTEKLALLVISDDTERQLLLRDMMAKHQSLELAFAELEMVHVQLKASQEKMAQSSKLAALGELAAGFSHELNQPLTGIRGFSQDLIDSLSSERAPSKKYFRGRLEDVIRNADKMAKLLAHFRNFARKDHGQSRPESIQSVGITPIVDQVLRLMERNLSKDKIAINTGIIEDSFVVGNPTHIEQILINLITNARDALLERKAKDASAFIPSIDITVESSGGLIELRVRDNALGIPPSFRNRIFDPFFTTKDVGQGLGLGLSISSGLATAMGGELLLESTGPQGTTFCLRLPVAKPHEAAA